RPPKTTLFPYTTLFRSNQIAEDTAITNYILPYKSQLEDKMNEVLGYAPEALIKNRNLPESELSNFFSDALLSIGKKVDPEVVFSDRKSTRLNSSHVKIS